MRVEERRFRTVSAPVSPPARRLSSHRYPTPRFAIRLGVGLLIAAAMIGSCSRSQTIGFYESKCSDTEVLVQVVGDWPDQIAGWPIDTQVAARTAFGACVPLDTMRMLAG